MGRYAHEPDNATKSCKSRGSHLRVHFKVCIFRHFRQLLCHLLMFSDSNFFFFFRIPTKPHRPLKKCHFVGHNVFWRMLWTKKNVYHSVVSMVELADALKLNSGTQPKDVGQKNRLNSSCSCWGTQNPTPTIRV